MQKLDIVGSFVRMLYRIIQKITQKRGWTKATTGVKPQPIYSDVYHNLVQDQLTSALLVQILGICIQLPNSPNNASIINITGLQILDNQLNQLKTKALQCVNFLLTTNDRNCYRAMAQGKHQIFHGMGVLLPLLIQSLIFFGQRTDIEQLLEEEIMSNFVSIMLESLSKAAVFDEFNEKVYKFLPNLILDVCFVLIRTTESERQQMYDNPQEFVTMALDTCEG